MPYQEQNTASRERLRELVGRLTDEQLGVELAAGGWTVAATLCHIAFWDRMWLGRVEQWDRAGEVLAPPEGIKIDADPINSAMLPWWLSTTYDQVRAEVVSSVEEIDARMARVSPSVAEEILRRWPRTITRALHRDEHMDEIEAALR